MVHSNLPPFVAVVARRSSPWLNGPVGAVLYVSKSVNLIN
jgi:hypothetical protein